MASTTPQSSHRRSASRGQPPSRPTTPLRPSSRTSLRNSSQRCGSNSLQSASPLEALEPAFAELSDSMADLEANFMHLQLMHESLSRFSESFASFLYGMNMNAFCVDFPEAPIAESFRRHQDVGGGETGGAQGIGGIDVDTEATFLTTDTSFVEHPPSSKATSKFSTPAPASKIGRGGTASRGRGIPRGPSSRGASGIGRGVARGRGRARS